MDGIRTGNDDEKIMMTMTMMGWDYDAYALSLVGIAYLFVRPNVRRRGRF